jgi:hypothetical protein
VQNSPYLCLCYSSHPGNSVYTGTEAMLHCCWNITFTTQLLSTSWICSQKGTTEFCVWLQMFCDMSEGAVFCNNSPNISIAETIYKRHDSIFFICRTVRHFNYPITLWLATQPQPLAKTAYKQEFDKVTAMLSHFTSWQLQNRVKKNFSSKWPVEHTPELWPLCCITPCTICS